MNIGKAEGSSTGIRASSNSRLSRHNSRSPAPTPGSFAFSIRVNPGTKREPIRWPGMNTVEYLQSQAALCRQLSSQCFDFTTSTSLRKMAEMHDERARYEATCALRALKIITGP